MSLPQPDAILECENGHKLFMLYQDRILKCRKVCHVCGTKKLTVTRILSSDE